MAADVLAVSGQGVEGSVMTVTTVAPRRSGVLIIAGLMLLIVAIWYGLTTIANTQKQYDECLLTQTVEYCEANYTLK